MITPFLSLLLLFQGIPILPAQSGSASGVLRNSAGAPAAHVRVAAMARLDAPEEAASGAALVSIAETDEAGRFRLETIPPGRYYIQAGRVDLPTYYPGVQEMAAASVITIAPGSVVSGLDFVMRDASVRPVGTDLFSFLFAGAIAPTSVITIPIRVVVEGGAKLPVSSGAGMTAVRLTNGVAGNPTDSPVTASAVTLSFPRSAAEFRASVVNLPDGYAVKSIMYGSTDVTNSTFKLGSSSSTQTVSGVASPVQVLIASTGGAVNLQQLQQLQQPVFNTGATAVFSSSPSQDALTITISVASGKPTAAGVRVTGRLRRPETRYLYISGASGVVYSDGSFESTGVPPGRHVVAAIDAASAPPLGRTIVVGDRDIDGVTLEDTPVLPAGVRTPAPAASAGSHLPGSTIPPATLRGRVLEELSREPITQGFISIYGAYRLTYPINSEGRFEIPRLLPGSYKLQLQIFGHSNVEQTVVVDEQDVELELATRRLY